MVGPQKGTQAAAGAGGPMRVLLTGWGAQDIEVALSQRTLILAPHGAGKSKLLDALRFLFLGRVPSLEGREQDAGWLVRNTTASIEVILPDGRRIARTLSRASNGGWTSQASASWMRNEEEPSHHAAIRGMVAQSDAEAAERLGLWVLLRADPSERAERLDRLMAARPRDPQEIGNLLEAVALARIAGASELPRDTSEETRRAFARMATDKAAVRALGGVPIRVARSLVQSHSLAELAARLRELEEQAHGALEGARRAHEELAAQANQWGAPPLPKALAEARESLGAAQRRWSALRERQRQAREAARRLDEARRRVHETQAMLEVAQKLVAEAPSGPTDEEYEAARAIYDGWRPPQPPAPPPELVAAREQVKRLREELDAIPPPADVGPALRAAQRRLARAKRALSDLEASPWGEVREVAATLCDRCARVREELLGIVQHAIGQEKEADRKEYESAVREVEKLQKDAHAAQEAQARIEQMRARLMVARTRRDELEETYQAQCQEALREAKARRDDAAMIIGLVTEVRQMKKDREARLREARARHEEAKKRLKGAEQSAGTLSAGDLAAQISAAEKEVARAEEALSGLQTLAARHQQVAEALSTLREREAEWRAWQALRWASERARDQEVAERGASVTGRMTNASAPQASGALAPVVRRGRT